MYFLFDTNIALVYLREHPIKKMIDETYLPFGSGNLPLMSVVSVGELRSIGLQNNWGAKRRAKLEAFNHEFLITDINSEDILNAYAEIDTFSQGKHKDKPLMTTSRNMGKNDLWIAATAYVSNATLLTTDRDFDHLNGVYFEVGKVQLGK